MKKQPFHILLLALIPAISFADPTQDLANAAKKHDIEAIKTSISNGADVNALDGNGNTPLVSSVWFPDAVQILINAKANVNLKNPLLSAATWGETESIGLLLKAGADIKAVDGLGHSALWLAAFNGNQANALKVLIDAGADVNFKDPNGFTPLLILAKSGKTPTERVTTIKSQIPFLEKAGLTVSERLKNPKESDYSTIEEMMIVLLNSKADINARANTTNETALIYAADANRSNAISTLINNKADLNLLSMTKRPALAYACESKKGSESALILIDAGASLNLTFFHSFDLLNEREGRKKNVMMFDVNSLMLASASGKVDVVQKFIDAKANLDMVTSNGGNKFIGYSIYNAAGIAQEYGQTNIVELLVKAGIKPVKKK